jgi:hypothetical protein
MNLSIRNFILVGLMAVIFILLAKVLVNKYEILKPLASPVNAV